MMIDSSMMSLMMEMATFGFVVPVVLIVVWKLRMRKSLLPVFVGAGVFFVFAFILEAVPHTIFLRIQSPVSDFLNNNVWVYALYGGTMAALFEETGRFVAYKYILKKKTERETAISYGLGHGGIECIIILGVGQLQNFTYSQLINNGKMDSILESMSGNPAAVKTYQSVIKALTNLKLSDMIWGGVERIAAILLQVALSVLVFYAVREAGQIRFLWIAMAVHALVDFIAAFYQAGVVPLFVVELCVIIITIGACRLAYQLYKKLPEDASGHTKKSDWAYAKTRYKENSPKDES
ncbi:MAG: YhfC family intramembrane metalloprotease [Lachnospiraceae bacterium]|nr:YhfC family intramembrane metalloprotease [Lachnospiraceae bacterium]